jgi:predicted secreted acid phosphatase
VKKSLEASIDELKDLKAFWQKAKGIILGKKEQKSNVRRGTIETERSSRVYVGDELNFFTLRGVKKSKSRIMRISEVRNDRNIARTVEE